VEAGAQEKWQDDIIAILQPITKERVVQKQTLTKAIGKLNERDLDKVKKALTVLDLLVQPAD